MKKLGMILIVVFLSVAIATTTFLLIKINDLNIRVEYNKTKNSMEERGIDSLTRALIKNRVIGSQNGYKIFDFKTVPEAIDFKKAILSLLAIDLLTLETKGKFGSARDKKARIEMNAFYNIILNAVISDEKELSKEIENLQDLIKSISEKESK